MKKIILDTSFIMSCVKQKIDFFEKLEHEGFQIIIPEQAIDELMGLNAKLALKILENKRFGLIRGKGKDADSAIIQYAEHNPETIVATLDAGLKKKVKNNKMVIRGKKKIEIV